MGLAAGGLLLGTVLAGAPPSAVLGTAAVLIAVGAAIYWPALGLAILVFTYPFDLVTYAGPVKLTSSAALMGILLAVLAGRQLLPNPPRIRRTPLDIPVILFALASVASLLSLTGNFSGQVIGLLKTFGGFAIFFMATQCLRDMRDALLVVGSLIASGLVQAVQTVIPFATGGQAVSLDTRATGTLIDPNLFAGYLVLIIPLVVALGVAFRQRWTIFPTILVTVAFSVALVVTLSRSGWLGLVAGALVLLLLDRGRRWHILVAIGVVTACIGIVGLAGSIAARLGPSDNPWEMLTSRTGVWTAAEKMAVDHPFFGVGIDTFQNFYPIYSGRDDELNHAHNLLLNVLAERGALGLAGFLLVAAFVARSLGAALAKVRSSVERALVVGLCASFVAYMIHSLFDVSYYDYKVLLLFWLLVAIGALTPHLVVPPNRTTEVGPREASAWPH